MGIKHSSNIIIKNKKKTSLGNIIIKDDSGLFGDYNLYSPFAVRSDTKMTEIIDILDNKELKTFLDKVYSKTKSRNLDCPLKLSKKVLEKIQKLSWVIKEKNGSYFLTSEAFDFFSSPFMIFPLNTFFKDKKVDAYTAFKINTPDPQRYITDEIIFQGKKQIYYTNAYLIELDICKDIFERDNPSKNITFELSTNKIMIDSHLRKKEEIVKPKNELKPLCFSREFEIPVNSRLKGHYMDNIYLQRIDGTCTTLNVTYFNYFTQKYGQGTRFFQNSNSRFEPLYIMYNNDLVGIVMPIRSNDTRDSYINDNLKELYKNYNPNIIFKK